MIETLHLKNHLAKAYCSKCGVSLGTAKLVPISDLPLGVIAHAVCENCNSENMVTITSVGTGVMAMASDLTSDEIKKFVSTSGVSYEEVLELHNRLKKESLWNLLQKKEHNSERKRRP
jgi:hypothetical protein